MLSSFNNILPRPSKTWLGSVALLCLTLAGAGSVRAGQLGHFSAGTPNIRDLLVPPPGFYSVNYLVWYDTDTFRDQNGNKVNSIPEGDIDLNVEADVDVYALAPALIWVSEKEVAGARYGAQVIPTFGNTSFQAALRTETDLGLEVDESQFGLGDIFVKPLWLGWNGGHYSVNAGYGFYAPIGKYDEGDVDNIGTGFWTHEFQLAGAWYPWDHQMTALTLSGTYETHSDIDDTDITPGDRFTVNWGASRYRPMGDDGSLIMEYGLMGYSQWQMDSDTGSDVNNDFNYEDEVHAVGVQVGLIHAPLDSFIQFHALQEFDAEARFEGQFYTLTLGKKFL